MTGGLKGCGEEEEPVISIQHDWEDSLFAGKKEVWISCKFPGRDSVQSKLKSLRDSASFTSADFSVTSFKRNSITIKHNESGSSCTFVAPARTYSSVHDKRIVSLDVSDGDLGVSLCGNNVLAVWDAKTGQVLRTLAGHVADAYKCKFFPSGIVILSGGSDMQMKIWCAKTGICPVTLIGHTGAVNDFCIVDKGRNIISVSKDGTARLWDCGKAESLGVIFRSTDVLNCCAIGAKENMPTEGREETVSDREIGTKDKLLVVGSEQGFVYGVAVYARRVLFTLNLNSAVNVVVFNGQKIVAGCQNGKVEMFECGNEVSKLKCYFESRSPIISGCLFKEHSFIAGRNDGTVSFFELDPSSSTRIRLTGSNFDPIYGISSVKDEVFTACRDSKIRKYVIDDSYREY